MAKVIQVYKDPILHFLRRFVRKSDSEDMLEVIRAERQRQGQIRFG